MTTAQEEDEVAFQYAANLPRGAWSNPIVSIKIEGYESGHFETEEGYCMIELGEIENYSQWCPFAGSVSPSQQYLQNIYTEFGVTKPEPTKPYRWL
jgi:hypothetical protein